MFDIMTTRQLHGSNRSTTRGGTRCSTTVKMLMMMVVMMLTSMTMLVLSASLSPSTITSTLAESEINDLNTLETPEQPTSKRSDDGGNITAKQVKPETRQFPYTGFMTPPSPSIPGCPLCDSSVYSYCSHKLIHDSCCCDFPGSMVYQKPPQCVYNDCSLLYAKSCYEHSLIKNCCCNNPY